MSGIGGGKPAGYRARKKFNPEPHETIQAVVHQLYTYIKELEKRVEDLETTYMEEKLLGKTKDSGTIES